MMLDVDNFKSINDRFGHDQGDRILRITGRSLSEHFGAPYCYRYGGDEFLVIRPDEGETEFRRRAQAVFDASPAPDQRRADERAEYSVGFVSGHVREESDLRRLISAADKHMYSAKRAGKNQIEGGPLDIAEN